MKNVVDLFIAKDRTAVFWFVMACAAILCCGLYVQQIISSIAKKPQYVIMDSSGIYYLAPSVEFENATELHREQTRLAMETIYTRKARNLVFNDRVEKIFYKAGIEQVKTELLKDAKKFEEEEREQTIEITETKVISKMPTAVVTEARGILNRTSKFEGRTKVESLSVAARFAWAMNPNMANNGLYPTVCMKIVFGEPKLIEEAAQ